MKCPTCDHEMSTVGVNRSNYVYWCWNCGTIRREDNLGEVLFEKPYIASERYPEPPEEAAS